MPNDYRNQFDPQDIDPLGEINPDPSEAPSNSLLDIIRSTPKTFWEKAGWKGEPIFSRPYVEQLNNELNNPAKNLSLDPAIDNITEYAITVTNKSIQYLFDCSKRQNCNPEKAIAEELQLIASLIKSFTSQINLHNLQAAAPIYETRKNIIANFVFLQLALNEKIAQGQFSNITETTLQNLYKAVIEDIEGKSFSELAKNCTGAIVYACPELQNENNITSLPSLEALNTTSAPMQVITTDLPTLTENTTNLPSTNTIKYPTQNITTENSTDHALQETTPSTLVIPPSTAKFYAAAQAGIIVGCLELPSDILLHIASKKGCPESTLNRIRFVLTFTTSFAKASLPMLYSLLLDDLDDENNDPLTISQKIISTTSIFLLNVLLQGVAYYAETKLSKDSMLKFSVKFLPLLATIGMVINVENGLENLENIQEGLLIFGATLLGAAIPKTLVNIFTFFCNRSNPIKSGSTDLEMQEQTQREGLLSISSSDRLSNSSNNSSISESLSLSETCFATRFPDINLNDLANNLQSLDNILYEQLKNKKPNSLKNIRDNLVLIRGHLDEELSNKSGHELIRRAITSLDRISKLLRTIYQTATLASASIHTQERHIDATIQKISAALQTKLLEAGKQQGKIEEKVGRSLTLNTKSSFIQYTPL
ncbi:MAG: hypothetical protein O7C59_08355, partial [Rickettsia endosymbiont of Ixodes persulcatus]|nr:hypothetical protein [Rickettsia endosymbiont of Ixodes persulcatus]